MNLRFIAAYEISRFIAAYEISNKDFVPSTCPDCGGALSFIEEKQGKYFVQCWNPECRQIFEVKGKPVLLFEKFERVEK